MAQPDDNTYDIDQEDEKQICQPDTVIAPI